MVTVAPGGWPSTAAARAAAAVSTAGKQPGWLRVCAVVAPPVQTLLVLGEADICTADQLREQLTGAILAWADTTVIDLSGLTFCGLAGLDAWRAAQDAGLAAGRDVQLFGLTRRTAWLDALIPRSRAELGASDSRGSGGPAEDVVSRPTLPPVVIMEQGPERAGS